MDEGAAPLLLFLLIMVYAVGAGVAQKYRRNR
jgi:hypothetical protein